MAKAVVVIGREHQITVKAAGLAYYAFNSFIPLTLLLVIGISTYAGMESVSVALEHSTGTGAGIDADQVAVTLGEVSGNGQGRLRAGVIASGIFLYSTARCSR